MFCPKPCKSFMSLNFVTLKPSPFKELAACNAFFLIRYRFPLSPLYFLCWFKFLIFWHCGGLGSSVESWKLSIFSPAKFAFQHHKPQLNSFQLCYYSFSSFFFYFFLVFLNHRVFSLVLERMAFDLQLFESHLQPQAQSVELGYHELASQE